MHGAIFFNYAVLYCLIIAWCYILKHSAVLQGITITWCCIIMLLYVANLSCHVTT